MRMFLNDDGTINAIGHIAAFPFEAPDFIIKSGHMRWQYNGGDMNNQANWTELESTFEEIEIEIP